MTSKDLIKEAKNHGGWYVAKYINLNEDFIRENKDCVDWKFVSKYQKLSEDFIREFQDSVYWPYISTYQKLSEDFISEFQNRVCWGDISIYQKLSEDFIRKFKDLVYFPYIKIQQILSEEFRNEFNLKIPYTSWLYKTTEWKERYIRENTEYQIENGMVIAYKSCRSDGYSAFNFLYHYEVGQEYESTADYNEDIANSFGLSAWTRGGL